jgi:hypothetical protein
VPAGHTGVAAGTRVHATTPRESLAAVPRIAEHSGSVGDRLARLADLPAWPQAMAGFSVPAEPEQIRALLADLVDAATLRYLFYWHGNAVMLVHSAAAPNALLRTLPPGCRAVGAESGRVVGREQRADRCPRAGGQSSEQTAANTFARAVEHGDEDVIKFADTAVEVFARTGDPDAIAAALRAADLNPETDRNLQ